MGQEPRRDGGRQREHQHHQHQHHYQQPQHHNRNRSHDYVDSPPDWTGRGHDSIRPREILRSGGRTSPQATSVFDGQGPLEHDQDERMPPPQQLVRASTAPYRRPKSTLNYDGEDDDDDGQVVVEESDDRERDEFDDDDDDDDEEYQPRRYIYRKDQHSATRDVIAVQEQRPRHRSRREKARPSRSTSTKGSREYVEYYEERVHRKPRRRPPPGSVYMEREKREIAVEYSSSPEGSTEGGIRQHQRPYTSSEESRYRHSEVAPPLSRRPSFVEDSRGRHQRSASDFEPPRRRRSNLVEAMASPRSDHRSRVSSAVPESRPPVTSKRPARRVKTVLVDAGPRRSKSLSSARSSALASSSNRHSSVLGGLLGSASGVGYRSPSRKRDKDKPVRLVECVACLGDVPTSKAPRLKCGHRMCHACLRRHFELSITDPQLMPPRCCTDDQISLRHVEKLFDTRFKRNWNRKYHEFTTQNRLYCPSRDCGEWIKPSQIRDEGNRQSARCPYCKMKVCVTCNGKWHSSFDCPRDEATQQFLRHAKKEGLQRCYNCKHMVEKEHGCNHMTCRCGAQFCMVCGLRWKTCHCEYFTFGPEDELQQMNIPQRPDNDVIWDDDEPLPPPRELRGFVEGGRRIVRRATYEDEPSRRMTQLRHDEDMARRLQYEPSDDEDGYDIMDGPHDAVGMGAAAGHHVSEDYRRSSGRAHRRATPPGIPHDRAGYVADVSRARGVRASSMERRLADRLSEHRHGGGHRTELPLGRPPPAMSSQPMMGGPPIGRPAFAPMAPAPMAPSMGMPPAPAAPQVPLHVPMAPPILPPPPHHPMMGVPYPPQMAMDRPPFGGMMGPEATPPMVRRRRASDGAPRSSMAGLTVPGGGMNRVFEWRTFVEPGIPEGEGVPG